MTTSSSKARQIPTEKKLLEEHLGEAKVKKLWSSIYFPALPFTPQDFVLPAILPSIFYLFRWGHRRGQGQFFKKFGANTRKPSIEDIAKVLSNQTDKFQGFSQPIELAILGDLLLSFCLENKQHNLGRKEPVLRIYPTHYLSSWVDLPERVSNFRYIPEMIVTLLVNQPTGKHLTRTNQTDQKFGIINQTIQENLLLQLFGDGIIIEGNSNRAESDTFQETTPIGIDQLLTIRIANTCEKAPQKSRPSPTQDDDTESDGSIKNQLPLATRAAEIFYHDLEIFLTEYGQKIPRQTLLSMLESCLGIGVTNIYLSSLEMLLEWENTGKLPIKEKQQPWSLFIDSSNWSDEELRKTSEESMDQIMIKIDRIPIILMCLRILDQEIQENQDEFEEPFPPQQPDATNWINLLGEIMQSKHPNSQSILNSVKKDCRKIVGKKDFETEYPIAYDLLNNTQTNPNPVLRLAETIIFFMKDAIQRQNFIGVLDSAMMRDQPNGMLKRRKRTLQLNGKRTESDARSVVLTNTVLDFLVHRHIVNEQKILSFNNFLKILREEYGFYIDKAPPGLSIPNELLTKNRKILEKRLRDLGLLIGVNDAESMKRLQTRF